MTRQFIGLGTNALASVTAPFLIITAIATAIRDPRAGDLIDIIIIALTTIGAIGMMICAKRSTKTGLALAAIPLIATIFGMLDGPSILWKLQLPLTLMPAAAGILIARTMTPTSN
jgi:hypothetical protein